MIQKAIVEAVENDYQVKVRIPKYDKMSYDGTTYSELSTGIICSAPGSLVNYSVGDIVLVGFENEEVSKPVVLGLLYTNNNPESSINFPGITDELDTLSQSIDKLNKANAYIHIKYSNDGGTTFTSLYDYSEIQAVDAYTYTSGDISINTKSTYVAWNIVDFKNLSSLNNFEIETTINAVFGENLSSVSSTNYVMEVPDTFNYADALSVSYVLRVINGSITDYNLSLFTDKNPIGSTEGDYIGIYYSNSSVPSANPIDYTWASIKIRIQKFIDKAYNDLLLRIQNNERYLYGQAKEDTVNTGTGVSSALTVSKDKLDISKKSTVELAKNPLNKENFISLNTSELALYFNNLKLVAKPDGHLQLRVGDK